MNDEKVLLRKNELIVASFQFLALLGISGFSPLFGNQLIAGPIVNAALFISVVLMGAKSAILLCFLPSIVSLAVGLLPAVLFPALPFIIASNVILVLVFSSFRKKNYWLGMIPAATFKFLFLAITSTFFLRLIVDKALTVKVSAMMVWPQLFTAICGGVLAFFFLKALKRV